MKVLPVSEDDEEDECPICYENKQLVILDGCETEKHKVCKDCCNKSKGKCWLCGDRIGDSTMEEMEEGHSRSLPPQAHQEIINERYNSESFYEIMKRIIDGLCIVTPVVCVTIIFSKLIEYFYCNINGDECNIYDLSIGGGFYVLGFLITMISCVYTIFKFEECYNNN